MTDSEVKKKARRGPTLSIVAALYLLFAIASSWPLATQLGDALPQGTDRAATVPLFHAWSLWWTADRMADGLTGFWTAPIFTPTPDSFLFSDPLILLGMLAAPLLWMGASPVLAHNLLLLLAVTGNGLFTFGLLRCLDIRRGPAALGGLMLLMLPYVHHELGVLMLVPLGGLLGFMWALIQFAKTPGPVPALLMGAAAAATYLMCGQYGIMLALVIAPASLCLVDRRWLAARAMGSLAAGGLLCALLIAPLILKQIETIDAHGFGRSESAATKSASHPTAWTLTPWSQLVPAPGIEMASEVWMQAHFPGTLKLLLALTGIVIGLRDPRLRRWTAFLLTATVLASLFSTLPRLEFGDTSPYRALRDVIPGLSTMRSFWRFIVVAQIGVVLLAVLSLEFMRSRSQARTGGGRALAVCPEVGARPGLRALAALDELGHRKRSRFGSGPPAVPVQRWRRRFRRHCPLDVAGQRPRPSVGKRLFRLLPEALQHADPGPARLPDARGLQVRALPRLRQPGDSPLLARSPPGLRSADRDLGTRRSLRRPRRRDAPGAQHGDRARDPPAA